MQLLISGVIICTHRCIVSILQIQYKDGLLTDMVIMMDGLSQVIGFLIIRH